MFLSKVSFLFLLPVPLLATSFEWVGANGINMEDALNWSPNGVPGPTDTATFDDTAANFNPSLIGSGQIMNVQLFTFQAMNNQYMLSIGSHETLNFQTGGVVNNSFSFNFIPTFTFNNSALNFMGVGVSGNSNMNSMVNYQLNSGATASFTFGGTTGSATYSLTGGSQMTIDAHSTGSTGTIVDLASGSMLTIGQNTTLGSLSSTDGTSTIATGGNTLTIFPGVGVLSIMTIAGGFTGGGGLDIAGGADVTLSGTNAAFTQGVTVDGSQLTTNTNSLLLGTGANENLTILTGGTFTLNQNFNGTFTFNTFSGSPSAHFGINTDGSTGQITLVGNAASLMGVTEIDGGGLIVDGTSNPQTSFAFENGAFWSMVDATGATVSTSFSGDGSVMFSGGGTFSFTAPSSPPSTYTGGTTITGSTVEINDDGDLGDDSGSVTLDNATLSIADTTTMARAFILTGADTLTLPSGDVTISGGITGAGSLTKTGPGDLTLEGSNTYGTGTTTTIAGGGFIVDGTSNPQTAFAFENGAFWSMVDATGGTVPMQFSGDGSVMFSGGGTFDFAASPSSPRTYTGGTTITGSTVEISADGDLGDDSGAVTLDNGTLSFSDALTLAHSLTLTGADTLALSSGDVTSSGGITGAGSLTKTGAGDLTLEGSNTYGAGTTTTIEEGGFIVNGTSNPQTAFAFENGAFWSMVDATGATVPMQFSGDGSVMFSGGGTFDFAASPSSPRTYTGGTTITGSTVEISADGDLGDDSGVVTLDNSTLSFSNALTLAHSLTLIGADTLTLPSGDVTINDTIMGAGSLEKEGTGKLILEGVNTYGGGTTVGEGALEGTTDSLQGTIVLDAATTLDFNQDTDGTFVGSFSGDTTTFLIKEGTGMVDLTTDNASFLGMTSILDGTLNLTATLGGSATVLGGVLTGTGDLLGSLTVNGGSLTIPHATDVFTVGGTYTQNSGGTYETMINDMGQSGLLDVSGDIILNGGTLLIGSDDGTFKNATPPYHVAHGAGVTGAFATVKATNPIFTPHATYTTTDIFIDFTPSFLNIALTYNERQVALQLDILLNGSPNAEQTAILDALQSASTAGAISAIDQMTGQQYATALLVAERGAEQFLNQIYYPLRERIGDPCPCSSCCCCGPYQFWMEGGAGQAAWRGNHDASGIDVTDFSVAVGAQRETFPATTFGIALSYVRDTIGYRVVGGCGENNTALGALYGLYRPRGYYLFGEVVGGYDRQSIERKIVVEGLDSPPDGTFRPEGNFNVFEAAFYGEMGKDWLFSHLLVQPFLGLEAGYYANNRIQEETGTPLDLTFFSRSYRAVYGVLGVHLTTPRHPCGLYLGVDLAVRSRFTKVTNHIKGHFNGFGTDFTIHGFNAPLTLFEGDLYLSKLFANGWEAFISMGGEVATPAKNYNFNLGVMRSF